jgi:hypothetical protein
MYLSLLHSGNALNPAFYSTNMHFMHVLLPLLLYAVVRGLLRNVDIMRM